MAESEKKVKVCRIACRVLEKGFSNRGSKLEKLHAPVEKIINAKKDGRKRNRDKSNNRPYAFKLFMHKNALTKKNGAKEKVVGEVSKNAA